jgi:hypothetical protein
MVNSKVAGWTSIPPTMPAMATLTHCPYCALNCGLGLRQEAGTVVGFDRWKRSPLTRGALCSKGVTAWEQTPHPDRILQPLVRWQGRLVATDWETALDAAAAGFARIASVGGDAANAVLGGGSLTNEMAYLLGKFARLALRTPHVDLNGRMCMTSAGAAYTQAFGIDRAPTPLAELNRTHAAVVIGANLSSSFPVAVPSLLAKLRRPGVRWTTPASPGSGCVERTGCSGPAPPRTTPGRRCCTPPASGGGDTGREGCRSRGQLGLVGPGPVGLRRLLRRVRRHHLGRLPAQQLGLREGREELQPGPGASLNSFVRAFRSVAVDVLAMADPYHSDDQTVIEDLVEDPVVAGTHTVGVPLALELGASRWPRLLREQIDGRTNA